MIVIFMDRTVQGVLNRDHGTMTFSVYHRKENLLEGFGRYRDQFATLELTRRDLAEGARRPLKSCFAFHCSPLRVSSAGPFQRRALSSGKPSRSSTRSTLESTRSSMVSGRL